MNTVISDQQPRACFLHCEKLRVLTNWKKRFIFGILFFVSSSLALSRRTFSARGGGGGVRSHPSHPPLPTRLASISESGVENIAVTASVFFRSKHAKLAAVSKQKVMSHLVNCKHGNRVKLSRVLGEIQSLCLVNFVNYCKSD